MLSVAATDGRPPASVPIRYGYSPGGNIRINTVASRRKARLIEQAGAEPSPDDVRETIAVRYLGEEGGREYIRRMDRDQTVLFTIRPDRWLTADFSADV